MKGVSQDLAAQVFRSALGPGRSFEPEAIRVFIAALPNMGAIDLESEIEMLGHQISAEFPFLGHLHRSETAPDHVSMTRWEDAVRWVFTRLRGGPSSNAGEQSELRALLVAINVLDAGSSGLCEIALDLANEPLLRAVQKLLDLADVRPFTVRQREADSISENLNGAVQRKDYDTLTFMLRQLMPQPFPDLTAAVVLLWQARPNSLADTLTVKNDVIFSMFVCLALKDGAVEFCLRVPLIQFKFICVYLAEQPRYGTIHTASEDMKEILIQVGKTDDWSGWMKAFFKVQSRPLLIEALAQALAELEEARWRELLEAVAISNRFATKTLAVILCSFANKVGPVRAAPMWRIAYELWDHWNYAKDEKAFYMFAPEVCALDYPVTVYFSRLPKGELDEEATRLRRSIVSIEETWFENISELGTERYRLLSRLRLLEHGRALAAGHMDILSSPIAPDGDLYSQARYVFHDVHAR